MGYTSSTHQGRWMCAPFTLPLSIKAAITVEIAAPPCKRCRSPSSLPPLSPPPLPSPSASPSPPPAMLLPHKRFTMTLPHSDTPDDVMIETTRLFKRSVARHWMWVQPRIRNWRDKEGLSSIFEIRKSSTTAPILSVTGEPIQHIIPLLVIRIVHHKDQIHKIHDHIEELPLERFETMQHEIDGAYTSIEAAEKEMETLHTKLGVAHERISDLEFA
ncbi:hypothetical protein Tco_1286028 [Tanacetum coccineum]